MITEQANIGKLGEKAAMKWLRERGYLIRDLNWRNGRYELDIVAERWETIHFVEVKSRKAGGFTTPEQAMTRDKVAALMKAVRSYLAQHHVEGDWQIDLVAVDVYPDASVEIRLIERAVEFRW